MIRSMTGYGRGESNGPAENCVIEIKSVNHRHIDIATKSALKDSTVDAFCKKKIKSAFTRGSFEVFLNRTDEEDSTNTLCFDETVLKRYFELTASAKTDFAVQGELDINTLFGLEGVLRRKKRDFDVDSFLKTVDVAMGKAIVAMTLMRDKEGDALQHDLSARLQLIGDEVNAIKEKYPDLMSRFQKRYRKRIQEATEDLEINEDRLAQEMAILLDKGDISEEITRLESHLVRFKESFELKPPVGKRLDFILQEMNREANTIGSKAVDSIITDSVVSMKCEIERMREQTQNVE